MIVVETTEPRVWCEWRGCRAESQDWMCAGVRDLEYHLLSSVLLISGLAAATR
jgi:hypothetical protein